MRKPEDGVQSPLMKTEWVKDGWRYESSRATAPTLALSHPIPASSSTPVTRLTLFRVICGCTAFFLFFCFLILTDPMPRNPTRGVIFC